jgi:uncharacterized protein YegL
MLRELADNPIINDIAAVSVLAFNDRPEILRPMSTLKRASSIAYPSEGYATNYAAVLRFMVEQHARDVRSVRMDRRRTDPDAYLIDVARPWVFFITDGRPFANGAFQPAREWLAQRERLVSGQIQARVVAIGLPGAEEGVLWRLATGDEDEQTRNAFIANRRTNPGELAASVVRAISSSISNSTRAGRLTIDPPDGMRRIDGDQR